MNNLETIKEELKQFIDGMYASEMALFLIMQQEHDTYIDKISERAFKKFDKDYDIASYTDEELEEAVRTNKHEAMLEKWMMEEA